MARKARGQDVLEVAKAQLSKAKTADALRQAQAVVFPLAYGMSLERTAEAIGVSAGWASQLRNRFIKEGKGIDADQPPRGGRRRENMSIEEEKEFLLPFFEKAKVGGILAKSFAESPAACRGDECMPFTGGYKGERSVPLIRIGPCVTI